MHMWCINYEHLFFLENIVELIYGTIIDYVGNSFYIDGHFAPNMIFFIMYFLMIF